MVEPQGEKAEAPALQAQQVPIERASLWTAERSALHQAIGARHEVLAGLYRQAIRLLDEGPWTRATLMNIGHNVRELCNRLPDHLPDVDDLPRRRDIDGPAKALAGRWNEHEANLGKPESISVAVQPSGDGQKPRELVSVPDSVLRAAADVVLACRGAEGNAHARRSALALGEIVQSDVRVDMLKESVDYFMENTHFSDRPPPLRDEVLFHFERIESIIRVRTGKFFDVAQQIEGVLAIANRRRGDQ